MEKKISVIDAISFAFKAILEHIRLFFFVFLIGIAVIALVVGLVAVFNMSLLSVLLNTPMFQRIQQCVGTHCFTIIYESGMPFIKLLIEHAIPLLGSGFVLALFFVGLDLGFKKITLDIYDKNESKVEKLWSGFNLVVVGFVAWILYCLMIWLGCLLFIVPGIIALLRFGFFPFLIIDKNLKAIEALKKSYRVTEGHTWDLFAFWIVIKIILYAGSLTYIGIILTWPLSTLAYTYIYRKLVPHV